MDIGAMPGADSAGYAGFNDQVNNHYLRLFGSAFLMSGVTAGITYSQRQNQATKRVWRTERQQRPERSPRPAARPSYGATHRQELEHFADPGNPPWVSLQRRCHQGHDVLEAVPFL
jgi:type IV secretory pathway VirB10-like protein